MRNRKTIITYIYGMLSLLLYVIILLITFALTGCKGKEYITVEKCKTDTVYQNKVMKDSVYLHDSTYLYVNGDSVFRDRWHTRIVYRNITDTVYHTKIVKELQPYPVTVKEKLTFRDITQYIVVVILLALVVYVLLWEKKS